jgi:hypothetical protein
MGHVNTEFTLPCASDKVLLAIQDVADTLQWPVLELSEALVVLQGPGQHAMHIWNLPKISAKLKEVDGSTHVSISLSVVGPLVGDKKRLTGVMGQFVNSVSLRIQTESIAINPTVALGEGQGGASQVQQQPDRITMLTQLKALLDQGVLTEEEFAAEKARVLAQD